MENQKVIVLDFGGQYNQLIARRVRECSVYCEVLPYTTPLEKLKAENPIGIIFTGGPNSVYLESSPHYDPGIFEMGVPILGICYGCQLMAYTLGGEVTEAQDDSAREYGKTDHEENVGTRTGEVDQRHQGAAQSERSVTGRMLDRMPGFMTGDADRRQRIAGVNRFREPQHPAGRVVVVGEESGGHLDAHPGHPRVVEQHRRCTGTGNPSFGRHLRILIERELGLERSPQRQQHARQQEQKIHRHQ